MEQELQGTIDDPMLEVIRRLLKDDFGHEWQGHIARFGDNLWIAWGVREIRKISLGIHGEYLIAKPMYVVDMAGRQTS